MLLSLKQKNKKNPKKQETKTDKQTITKQTKAVTAYNSFCLHYRWRCYQEIALNDQQVGRTSLSLLSP